MPAARLYTSVDMLPTIKLPSTERITATINPSTGPSANNANKLNALPSPSFAPGNNSGGNMFSTTNATNPSAESTASTAARLADILLFVTFFNIRTSF